MMGFFSNLFAKQNCAVCGKECGTMHRSKLRDGQFLCDDCGNKCSKYIRLSELTLEGDNEIGPFCSMPSLNLSGDELLTVGELDSSGDYYLAAFDLEGNELAGSSQPVGNFDAVMMKRPNGYLLDTGYVWELYGPDGTFLEKSVPVGERETLCQLCGDFCTFDVFLPLEENAFLAVGHHGKASEPDEPVVFRSQNHIDEIKGVYVPFWLFDSDADAQLRFTATRTRCWSDSKYDYIETNYYSVRRDGTLGFDAVPVDGSSKIEDDLMESIEPFAMQDAIPFQTAYLAGYVADKYDVNAEDSIERANKRIRRSTEETFQQTVTGYDSVKVENSSIQLHGGKAKYALFPVWLLSTSWRGENYLFAMNGQSGKFVGDLPVDKGAARKWMLGLTAALSAASYGVMWLLWLARIL